MHNSPRPLSPHITIYKPQISSMLSIAHRITGVANFIGMGVIVWWVISIASNGHAPESTWLWEAFQGYIGLFCLMGWTFFVLFHLCTRIRHLFWDVGKGLGLKAVSITGWLAVIAASVLWLGLWVAACYLRDLGG